MNKPLRVAFFPDSYLEVNGVAMTSRRLVGFAKENNYPFLCIYAEAYTMNLEQKDADLLNKAKW